MILSLAASMRGRLGRGRTASINTIPRALIGNGSTPAIRIAPNRASGISALGVETDVRAASHAAMPIPTAVIRAKVSGYVATTAARLGSVGPGVGHGSARFASAAVTAAYGNSRTARRLIARPRHNGASSNPAGASPAAKPAATIIAPVRLSCAAQSAAIDASRARPSLHRPPGSKTASIAPATTGTTSEIGGVGAVEREMGVIAASCARSGCGRVKGPPR